MATRFLSLSDLIELIRRSGVGPVRDVGLLESAASRPQTSAFGEDAYPSSHLKASSLLHSLVRNHALVDGNKRLGWLATTVFLDLNGHTVEMEDAAAFQLVMDVAEGILDVDAIASRLGET